MEIDIQFVDGGKGVFTGVENVSLEVGCFLIYYKTGSSYIPYSSVRCLDIYLKKEA